MKNLFQLSTALFLLVQTIGYGQTKETPIKSNKQDTTIKKQNTAAEIDTEKFKHMVGEYLLAEADFTLEIVLEKNEMFIISPFSKDPLIQKNETTLSEPTRGVDLEIIKDDKNGLKFTQNGYETIITRVKAKTEK